MKKVIERIVKELENVSYFTESTYDEDGYSNDDSEEVVNLCKAVDIVEKVLEEYVPDTNVGNKDGWIPVEERLPEDMQKCLTIARIYVVPDHVDEPDNYIGIELNIYSERFGWLGGNEVIEWQPLPSLPQPYKEKGE